MTDGQLPEFESDAEAKAWFDRVDVRTIDLTPAKPSSFGPKVELRFVDGNPEPPSDPGDNAGITVPVKFAAAAGH